MTESDDGFISRWSRRKRGAGGAADRRADDAAAAPAAPGAATPAPDEARARIVPEDLPDPDSLSLDCDFTVFLQDGVPEALRRRALRRLWRLDPVFANLDGLNDYDEDYTDAALVVKGLKTAYKVGRGFVADDEGTTPEAPEPAPSPDELQASDIPGPTDSTPAEDDVGRAGIESAAPEAGDERAEPPVALAQAAAKPRAAVEARPGPPRRRGARQRRWGRPSD